MYMYMLATIVFSVDTLANFQRAQVLSFILYFFSFQVVAHWVIVASAYVMYSTLCARFLCKVYVHTPLLDSSSSSKV